MRATTEEAIQAAMRAAIQTAMIAAYKRPYKRPGSTTMDSSIVLWRGAWAGGGLSLDLVAYCRD